VRRKDLFPGDERIGQTARFAPDNTHMRNLDDCSVREQLFRPVDEGFDARPRCQRIAAQVFGESRYTVGQERRSIEKRRECLRRRRLPLVILVRGQRRQAGRQIRLHALQDHVAERLLDGRLPCRSCRGCRALQPRHLEARQFEFAAARPALLNVFQVLVVENEIGQVFDARRIRKPADAEHIPALLERCDLSHPGHKMIAVNANRHGSKHHNLAVLSGQDAAN
jgi:hypothetical protein